MREFKKRSELEKDGLNLEKIRRRITTAKIAVMDMKPYLAPILGRMGTVLTMQVPTSAVDIHGKLYFNPKWADSLSDTDLVFEVAHEAGHIIEATAARFKVGYNPGVWNKASDQMVDTMLRDGNMKPSKISEIMVTEDIMKQAREDGLLEVRYKNLLKEMQDKECEACKQSGPPKNGGKDDQEGGGDQPSDKPPHTCGNVRQCTSGSMMKIDPDQATAGAVMADKWEKAVIKGLMDGKAAGNLPGYLEEMLHKLTKPRVNWLDHIRRAAVIAMNKSQWSYSRIARRSHSLGLRLPGHRGMKAEAICVIDSSGSIVSHVDRFLSEVKGVLKQSGAQSVLLLMHDYEVYFVGNIKDADLTKLKVSAGGTSHVPVFEELAKHDPKMVICFTDLETCFPAEHPKYPVIWCVPEAYAEHKAPFGKVLPVNFEED